MNVVFEAEGAVKGAHALHQVKQVVVAAEEDMQPHFNVVAIWIDPTANFAADKGTGFKNFDFVACID
jgi:hypothetical protein